MPVIKQPTFDANGIQTGYQDYTTTNNTATGWGGRRKNNGKRLASNFYPYTYSFVISATEPV